MYYNHFRCSILFACELRIELIWWYASAAAEEAVPAKNVMSSGANERHKSFPSETGKSQIEKSVNENESDIECETDREQKDSHRRHKFTIQSNFHKFRKVAERNKHTKTRTNKQTILSIEYHFGIFPLSLASQCMRLCVSAFYLASKSYQSKSSISTVRICKAPIFSALLVA